MDLNKELFKQDDVNHIDILFNKELILAVIKIVGLKRLRFKQVRSSNKEKRKESFIIYRRSRIGIIN